MIDLVVCNGRNMYQPIYLALHAQYGHEGAEVFDAGHPAIVDFVLYWLVVQFWLW